MRTGARTTGGPRRELASIAAIGLVALLAVALHACGGRLSEDEYYQRASDAVEGVATASVELSSAADQAANGIQFMLVVKTAGNRTTKAAKELESINPPKSEEESNRELAAALRTYQHVLSKAIAAARNEDRAAFAAIRPELDVNSPEVRTIRQAAARFRQRAEE